MARIFDGSTSYEEVQTPEDLGEVLFWPGSESEVNESTEGTLRGQRLSNLVSQKGEKRTFVVIERADGVLVLIGANQSLTTAIGTAGIQRGQPIVVQWTGEKKLGKGMKMKLYKAFRPGEEAESKKRSKK